MNTLYLLLFLSLFAPGLCFGTQTPTWLTSPYFRAGNQAVIASLTGNTFAPIYVFTFSTAFSSIPNLGYGIKNYRGADTIIQEFYQIRNLGITSTTFTVQVEIYGITNLYLLTVAYLAVDPTFPHLLNIFVNVPVNYTSGNLVNISSYSSSMTTFTEVINYSQQAAGRTYNSFPSPYSSNVIVLFINCFWIQSQAGSSVQMSVSASVLSDTEYSISVSVFKMAKITNLHFSMIFYNADDIASSNKYLIMSYQWVQTTPGGFTPIPQAFLDNFIMALTQFQTTLGSCGFEYQWEFVPATANTTFGVQILPSVQISNNCGFNQSTSSIFYLQTWQCNAPYLYFNSSSNLCQDLCSSTYFGSNTTYTCTPCYSPICLICSNSSNCITCDPAQYALAVNSTCICQNGYFMFSFTCNPCSTSDQYCTACNYSGNYSDTTLDSTLLVCTDCNATSGYFLDPNFGICLPCSLPNCLSCSSLIACSLCDPASHTMLDSSFHCSTCVVIGCLVCGATPSICVTCNTVNRYTLTGTTCSLCAAACTCGGYSFPRKSNGDCSTICGDGLILGSQQCDDGNSVSGDGCSSACKVENYFSCYSQPSLCYVSTPFSLALVDTAVSSTTCNIIAFTFAITPYLSLLDRPNINWSGFLTLTAANLTLISTSYSLGSLTTTYSYSSTLEGQSVSYQVNPINLLPSSIYFSQLALTSSSIVVHSNSNIVAVLNSKSVCLAKDALTTVVYASEGVSYLTLLVSLFSCKIVGLELFGVLQLSFLVLSNDDNVNQLLASILGRKEVNGPQVPMSISEVSQVSNRVKANGFTTEIFLSNFNIMFLVNLLTCLVGGLGYAVTYLINKDSKDVQSQDSQQGESRSTYFHRLSKYTLKQGMLTLVMFNAFNLSFSTGLQIKYLNQVDSLSIICMLISLTLLAGMVGGLLLASTPQFGQFFDKFGQRKAQSNYMLVSLIYRITMGFLLAVLNEWLQSGFVLLGVNMAFLTYIFLTEPFKQKWQNRRSQAIHVTHFIILFVHLYYRLENDDDPIETSYLYTPAYCQLLAVGGTIIMSLVMLGRQVYMKYFSASKYKAEHLKTGLSELAHQQPPSFQQSMIEAQQSQ